MCAGTVKQKSVQLIVYTQNKLRLMASESVKKFSEILLVGCNLSSWSSCNVYWLK